LETIATYVLIALAWALARGLRKRPLVSGPLAWDDPRRPKLFFSQTNSVPDFSRMSDMHQFFDKPERELPSRAERRRNTVAARLYGIQVAPPPILFNTTWTNLRAGIVNRCLRAGPPVVEEVEAALFRWARDHFDLIFGEVIEILPKPFEVWLTNFPAGQQKTLKRARRYLDLHTDSEIRKEIKFNTSSVFVKSELQIWEYDDTPGEVEEIAKDPRIIQPTCPEYNVMTGPWVHAFQEHLHEVWDLDNWCSMGCARTNVALGRWYDQFPIVVEGDFARFDATVTTSALMYFCFLARKFGAPAEALWAFRQRHDRYGYSRDEFGLGFRVTGTMDSGNTYTYCLNTIWNVLIQTYAYYSQVSRRMKFSTFIKHYRILASGDDSLVLMSRELARVIRQQRTLQVVADLGCTLELSPDPFPSFCSMFFWPVLGQLNPVTGLKPGRVLRRFPWLMRPQENFLGQLRGNILGIWGMVHFVPILREYFDRTLELIGDVEVVNTRSWTYVPALSDGEFLNCRILDHNTKTIHYHPETMSIILERYGWTAKTLYSWWQVLQTASLMQTLEFGPLASVLREL